MGSSRGGDIEVGLGLLSMEVHGGESEPMKPSTHTQLKVSEPQEPARITLI